MHDRATVHRVWRWTGRPGPLVRTLIGCLIVLLCSAGVGALIVDHEASAVAHDLRATPRLHITKGVLAPTPFGGAQTILLVGNDQRTHTTTAPVLPHSNEMLLVRIDPSKPWISMMSLPRELDVPIDTAQYGVVHTRLNASLMFGGIPLLVKTIRQVTGLSVNHVIVIDFDNFERAIDDLGCVDGTIDRRYLHVNTATSEQYQQINLQPGYQRLCGRAALSFVSYRHGDTSLIRDARDQEFLLEAKQQLGPTLVDHLGLLERVIGQTVQTDAGLRTTSGILSLLGTAVAEEGKPVRQVSFRATLLATVDTASPRQIAESVHSFLDGSDVVPRRGVAGQARALQRSRDRTAGPLLMHTPASELAAVAPRASELPFALEYPRLRAAAAAGGPVQVDGCSGVLEPIVCLRTYRIFGPDHRRYPAYVLVTSQGDLDQYYDVQGATWTTAPMFHDPGQLIHVGGRTYALYYSGAHLNVVAWWTPGAVYWVHNTITDALDNREMLAIAESTTPLGRSAATAAGHRRVAGSASRSTAPPASITAAGSGGGSLGELGGVGALVAMVLSATGIVLLAVQLRRMRAARRTLQRVEPRIFALLGETHDDEAGAAVAAGSSVSSSRPTS